MGRKRHSDAFCHYDSFHHWRNIPSGDVQCSCVGMPAYRPVLPLKLRSCQTIKTIRKKFQGLRKKESASLGNDFVLNFLFMFLAYRKLNVTVQALYWKVGLYGCDSTPILPVRNSRHTLHRCWHISMWCLLKATVWGFDDTICYMLHTC